MAEKLNQNALTHGESRNGRTPEFRAWLAMRQRCLDKNTKRNRYHIYRGRGIRICKRWMGNNGYLNFLKDMGRKPTPKHTLERIRNGIGYCPTNCKWATQKEQQNNRRNNTLIKFEGLELTVPQWAEKLRIKRSTLQQRLGPYGWSVEKALTTPTLPRSERNRKWRS